MLPDSCLQCTASPLHPSHWGEGEGGREGGREEGREGEREGGREEGREGEGGRERREGGEGGREGERREGQGGIKIQGNFSNPTSDKLKMYCINSSESMIINKLMSRVKL